MATEVASDLLSEGSKTFPGHGLTVLKVFDTRSKKATVVKAKLKSQELTSVLDASNEEDITSQFKVKRATKEYAAIIIERLSVVFRDGQLKIEFDWTGIRRIQQEAILRAEKLAERKKKDEEDRIAREKHMQEEKLAEQERQRQAQLEEARKIQAAKDAEEARLRREQEAREYEAKQKKKAFEDKIGNAILNGGVMMTVPKHEEEQDEGDEGKDDNPNIVKTWSDEHRSFYYTDLETNVLTWRDPRVKSVWEKLWDNDLKVFKFLNKQTGEVIYEEPYSNRIEKIWVEEKNAYFYVNRETGDTEVNEPYY
jgi:hypothetical protein